MNYVAVAALSIFLSGVLISKILLIAFRKKLFDEPDPRKIHQGAVPRLGGIAFTPVICISIAFVIGVNYALGEADFLASLSFDPLAVSMGFCSLLLLYLVGMADDLVGVRWRAKFIAEILCGCFLVAGGLSLTGLDGILDVYGISPWVGWPLTVLCVMFVVNAVNLIDGLDGLASGLSAITFAIYGIFLAILHQYFYAMVAFAALGVLVPFFYYNVFGNASRQRKIFMGDTGSLTMGMLISILGLELIRVTEGVPAECDMPKAMVVILSPLIIPCFDVVRVFMYRIRHNANPFLPDNNHIHHRLLAAGVRHHMAMLAIVGVSAGMCVANIALSYVLNINLILLLDIVAMALWVWWLDRKAKSRSAN